MMVLFVVLAMAGMVLLGAASTIVVERWLMRRRYPWYRER